MVNVAGRSKGCSTCRKRRIKCDETHPICKQCQRKGLHCEGPKGTAFIQGTVVASRRSEKRIVLSTGNESGGAACLGHRVPASVSLSGYEFDIYLCYTLKHVRGGPVELALSGVQRNDIVAASRLTTNGQIFHQAILSFAAIFFGMQHTQASITNEGYALLGTSLSRLNHALSDPRTHVSDDVLLSVITLALLESFVPSSPGQYLNHMLALEKLLELRGPSSLPSGLLRGVRYMILFASLRTRRPSILAHSEWKRVLRESCPEAEIHEQDLFDVIADCTVLLPECDGTSIPSVVSRETNVYQKEKIEQSALTLLFYLHAWQLRWITDERNSYREISSPSSQWSPVYESSKDSSSRTRTLFEFSSVSAATTFLLYNTALIYVLQILNSLSYEAPSVHLMQSLTSNSRGNNRGIESDIAQAEYAYSSAEQLAALDICRCVPYLAGQSGLDLRVVNLAITTVWMIIGDDDSARSTWMRGILSTKGQELIARGLRPDNNDNIHTSDLSVHQRFTEIQTPPATIPG